MKQNYPAQIITRVSERDRARLEMAAARDGLFLSSFIRMKLRGALDESERACSNSAPQSPPASVA